LSAAEPCSTAFANYYCPIGSIYPRLCPVGTYAENQITCTPCSTGNYCWPDTTGATNGIVGECAFAEGYLCREGAFSPRPVTSGVSFIQPGSVLFNTYNGPVIPGHIAQTGGVAAEC